MREAFEAKVAPTILYVLDVLDEISSSQGREPQADQVRRLAKSMLARFDVRGPDEEQFKLAKTALVCWIDEVLINSEWFHASEWKDRPLEWEIYDTRSRAWKFFENAELARGQESSDALEVFALCVANGFRGVYRNKRGGEFAELAEQEFAESGAAASQAADRTLALRSKKATGTASVESARADHIAEFVASLPDTLELWLGSVFGQVLCEPLQAFESSGSPDSAREVHPLWGAKALARWSMALAISLLISLLLVLGLKAWGGW